VSQEYKTGNKSLLVPLLERCTRELQATGRYRDDIRYLRIWIEYVRLSSAFLSPPFNSEQLFQERNLY
jgi:hypothetical protein